MRQFLYSREHINCHNYRQNDPAVSSYSHYPGGHKWEGNILNTEILCIFNGGLFLSYDFFINASVSAGQILLLPAGTNFKAHTDSGVAFLRIYAQEIMHLCDRFSLEDLSSLPKQKKCSLPILRIKPLMNEFLILFAKTLADGLSCRQYLELKTKEFFFLLRGYYTKEELMVFFRPMLNKNMNFASFILDNYRDIKTVNQFANLYSCSISSFDKKFRQAFGTSAYQWMKKKKTDFLFHEISTTNKTFRQIAEEQGFLSLPQFTDFCKKHLGDSPGRIRKRQNSNKNV